MCVHLSTKNAKKGFSTQALTLFTPSRHAPEHAARAQLRSSVFVCVLVFVCFFCFFFFSVNAQGNRVLCGAVRQRSPSVRYLTSVRTQWQHKQAARSRSEVALSVSAMSKQPRQLGT